MLNFQKCQMPIKTKIIIIAILLSLFIYGIGIYCGFIIGERYQKLQCDKLLYYDSQTDYNITQKNLSKIYFEKR